MGNLALSADDGGITGIRYSTGVKRTPILLQYYTRVLTCRSQKNEASGLARIDSRDIAWLLKANE